jgi:endonuclease YncB( thermonuclease family)
MRLVAALALAVAAVPLSAGAADGPVVVAVADPVSVDVQRDDASIERIYMAGLDAGGPGSPGDCMAAAAMARIHELVDGQPVSIETDAALSQQDPSGRNVGYVWLPDGRDLNEVLLHEGLARMSLGGLASAHEAELAAAQASAVEQRTGVWAAGACPLADAPAGLATSVAATSEKLQVVQIAAGILHQQAQLAASSGAVLSQPDWQQSTVYAVAELHGAAMALANPPTADSTQPLAPRFATIASDVLAATDAYHAAADAKDAQMLAASDAQIQTSVAALQPLTQELLALGARYNLGD